MDDDPGSGTEDEAEAPPWCDTCGIAAIPIVYGFPMFTEEDVYQGGCLVYAGAPSWWCKACEVSVSTDDGQSPIVAGAAAIYMTGAAPPARRPGLFERIRRSRRR
jgi:hypothetical protein